ncbi:hypothetical protein EGW08_023308 [Elysia chlorotica]|uniref:Uncharacterized protein n=1 Tax=Elysia chlorotica TaxID=188477 RepID=A0A3S1GYZ0_ELYCH|nr:hypothetical protein EGW08_023308 [Elysia chlorotica]
MIGRADIEGSSENPLSGCSKPRGRRPNKAAAPRLAMSMCSDRAGRTALLRRDSPVSHFVALRRNTRTSRAASAMAYLLPHRTVRRSWRRHSSLRQSRIAGQKNNTCFVDSDTYPQRRQLAIGHQPRLDMLHCSNECSVRKRKTCMASPRDSAFKSSARVLLASYSRENLSSLSILASAFHHSDIFVPRRCMLSVRLRSPSGWGACRPSLASPSAISFPRIPTCEGIHWQATRVPVLRISSTVRTNDQKATSL